MQHRNARVEIRDLVRWGHLLEGRAAGLSPCSSSGQQHDGRPDYVDEHSEQVGHAFMARARLNEMHARPSPDGTRFAAVLWYAHGERGEVLDGRESQYAQVAERYGNDEERARFLAALPPVKRRALCTTAMEFISYGGVLLAVAEAAYELDDWTAWLPPEASAPPPPPTVARVGARARFLAGVAASWETRRVALLGPREHAPEGAGH